MVYASSTLSLATLELFVHVDPDDLPDDLVSVRAELPDELLNEIVDPKTLPPDWRRTPSPVDLQDFGTAWVQSSRGVALVVPSAIVPSERNLLLNPAHADMARVVQHPPEPFRFDPRMRK